MYSVEKIIGTCYNADELPFIDGKPGKKWFRGFLKRHPIITQKKSEYLSDSRAHVTEKSIRKWFEKVRKLVGEAGVEILNNHPERVFNVDETAFFLNKSGQVVLAERGRQVYNINKNTDKENVTVSICVNAKGEMAPPLILYAYERVPLLYRSSLPEKWSCHGTPKGWMDGESFYEYFGNVFIPWIRKKFPNGEQVIVFFDGHSSHLTLELSDLFDENNIIAVCLYPSTTQILQPLDVAFFKALKAFWQAAKSLFEFTKKLQIGKHHIPIILKEIFENPDCNFAESLKNGFRKCGLSPFNPDNVDYSNLPSFVANTHEPEDIDASPPAPMSTLDFIESQLDENLVMRFKTEHKADWSGDVQDRSLFNLWRVLRKNDRSYSTHTETLEFMEPAQCVSELQYESIVCTVLKVSYSIFFFFLSSFRRIQKSLSILKTLLMKILKILSTLRTLTLI